MDVSCPQCDTLYELDERQIGDDGATLKCSQCGHLFRLQPQAGVLSESRQRWMVRQHDTGDVLYFTGFDTLHEWCMGGEVGPDDEISRTGEKWTKLRSIGEFAPIFQVVESIADLSGDAPAQRRESDELERLEEELGALDSAPEHDTADSPATAADDESSGPGRQRTSTDSQFPTDGGPKRDRQVSDEAEDAESTAQPADSAPKPTPQRAPKRTPTHTPGEPADDSDSSPAEPPTADPEPSPTDSGPPLNAEFDETFGEMTSPQPPTTGEMEAPGSTSRRWPAVLVVLAIAAAAAGIWQREELERFAAEWLQPVESDRYHEPTVDQRPQPASPLEAAMVAVDGEIRAGVERAEGRIRAVGTAAGIEDAEEFVGEAMDEAVEDAEKQARQLELERAGPDTLAARGRSALDDGRTRQARELFEQALDRQSNHPGALIGMGWVYLNSGDAARAASTFQEAHAVDRSRGEALIGLGRAERSRGNDRAALSAYEQYLRDFPDGSEASIAEYQRDQIQQRMEE